MDRNLHTINVCPISQKRARFNRCGRVYDPSREEKKKLRESIRKLNLPLVRGLCEVYVVFRRRRAVTAVPDLDNYVKAFLDSANELLFEDDRMVVRLEAYKQKDETDGIDFEVREI
ncbi:MAG: RusA family crossover junction endodeoxyribonuclease [Simkaniaceae bacterium]|nr:RusA family crossover junction endodeoxyribonuclease [Simkaniaceae bacterium]